MNDEADFDPYHKWLGIPPKDQPPHHYRLLAIDLFESDPDVIDSAADARMMLVRTLQTGKRFDLTQQILNEVASARACLLDAERRKAYDVRLRSALAAQQRQSAAAPHIPAANSSVGVQRRATHVPPTSVPRTSRVVANEAELLVGELIDDSPAPAAAPQQAFGGFQIAADSPSAGATSVASRHRIRGREKQSKRVDPLLYVVMGFGGMAVAVVVLLVVVVLMSRREPAGPPAVAVQPQTPPRVADSGLKVSPPKTPAAPATSTPNSTFPTPGSDRPRTDPPVYPPTNPSIDPPRNPPRNPSRPPDLKPPPAPSDDPDNPFGEGATLNERPLVVQHGKRDIPVSAQRMRDLLAECEAFDWTPTTPEQLESLSELMTHLVWTSVQRDAFVLVGTPPTPLWNDIFEVEGEIMENLAELTWTPARREAVNRMMLAHAQEFSGVLFVGDSVASMELRGSNGNPVPGVLVKVAFSDEFVVLREMRVNGRQTCLVMGQIQSGAVALLPPYDGIKARVLHIGRVYPHVK